MAEVFDTLLLLALPASGKSEVRNYLTHKDPARFHMGPTVQLDDYPYVHLQIRLDEELVKRGQPRLFHSYDGGPFNAGWHWGALIRLLDEDYAEVRSGVAEVPAQAALHLFERLDRASVQAGGEARIAALDEALRAELAGVLEAEARALYEEKAKNVPESLEGRTVVIEFARGGEMNLVPLPDGYGYAGSLRHFSAELLARAAILYIWVEPHESRRKNRARARPDGQGSILFHGTPEPVMYEEYGRDDMGELLAAARKEGTLPITAGGVDFDIPFARFDNRIDKTSFLRGDPSEWTEAEVAPLDAAIFPATEALWAAVQSR
ncbi:MAG: hypothetical protein JXX28_00725 [Deltaproteobacteria bacterium]|nr:hypothetical protein [Deltaproteobacteria bacterium]